MVIYFSGLSAFALLVFLHFSHIYRGFSVSFTALVKGVSGVIRVPYTYFLMGEYPVSCTFLPKGEIYRSSVIFRFLGMRNRWSWLRPYPVASFGIRGAEPLPSTNTELDVSNINYSKLWSVII
jgi:hypothetical protein